jgi:hypothetical protein
MRSFISYKDWLNEKFMDYVKMRQTTYEIHKNPQPYQLEPNIRLLGNYNGDLWAAIANVDKWDYATHAEIAKLAKQIDPSVKCAYNQQEYGSIGLHRYKDTNVLGLAESYFGDYLKDINKHTWKLLQKNHPEWKFILKKEWDIRDTDL